MSAHHLNCLACGHAWPIAEGVFLCPACGGRAEVAIEDAGGDWLPRDDLFRYAPLLPFEDWTLASPLRIGRTPIYRAERLGASVGLQDVWLKDESVEPSGSLKDRAGAAALLHARQLGAPVLAVASTGNAGSSMACLCASVGLRCVVFVPETAPPAKLAQLRAYGATVLAVRGSYDDAYALCGEVCKQRGWYNRSTGLNPFTREGKKTCAFEIAEALADKPPDRVIVPVGDGNIISGIWKGFREWHARFPGFPLPRVDAAQAEGSAAVTRAVEGLRAGRRASPDWRRVRVESVEARTVADSIAVDEPRDGLAAVRAVWESNGEAVLVSDGDVLEACVELASRAGVFAEPAAAASWAGLKRLAAEGRVRPDERIVCLITGNGLKDPLRAAERAPEPLLIPKAPAAALRALEMPI